MRVSSNAGKAGVGGLMSGCGHGVTGSLVKKTSACRYPATAFNSERAQKPASGRHARRGVRARTHKTTRPAAAAAHACTVPRAAAGVSSNTAHAGGVQKGASKSLVGAADTRSATLTSSGHASMLGTHRAGSAALNSNIIDDPKAYTPSACTQAAAATACCVAPCVHVHNR